MNASSILAMRVVFVANILVAGVAGGYALFLPDAAVRTVFGGAATSGPALRIVGALWLAIAVLSALGVARPMTFAPVLLLQLVYKAGWLLVVAVPALMRRDGTPLPVAVALFFLAWVIALPFVIPFRQLLAPPP